MLFNSLHFLWFFIVVTALYFALPYKYRWLLLLIASAYFYMIFKPIYILILGFTIIVDYFAGIWIEEHEGKQKKLYLIASICANVGVLAIFKYYNFFIDNIEILTGKSLFHLSILLPIGLSFHTFQAMSYTIEVYRGKQKAERHLGIYALYVMFYPQLVAGPIERPQNMLHQFREKHDFDREKAIQGLKWMVWGFFMKVVIADRLAEFVNAAYSSPASFDGLALWTATAFFSIQIYCDFAGYSLIALGSAKIMGFDMMQNFDAPYFASNLGDYWRRWHISLSTWFRDYLYIPLGGSKKGFFRHQFNLFFVFLMSGLWHGASWNYVIWGALHGIIVVIWGLIPSISFIPSIIQKTLGIIVNFTVVTLAFVFFRSSTIPESILIFKKIFLLRLDINSFTEAILLFKGDNTSPSFAVCMVGLLAILFIKDSKMLPLKFRQIAYQSPYTWGVLVLLILFLGNFDVRTFLYFQF